MMRSRRIFLRKIKILLIVLSVCLSILFFSLWRLKNNQNSVKIGSTLSTSSHRIKTSQKKTIEPEYSPTPSPTPTIIVFPTPTLIIYPTAISSNAPNSTETTTSSSSSDSPTPTPTTITDIPMPSATPSATPTAIIVSIASTSIPTATMTVIPTSTNTPTNTPTHTLTPTMTSTPAPTPIARNYTVKYFNNTTLSGSPTVQRTDYSLNFTWGAGSPDSRIDPDTFSAIWTTTITAATTGNYGVTTRHDDGMKIYVDNNLFHNHWVVRSATTETFTVYLSQGNHTVKVEYFENLNDATAYFNITKLK